jgi:hypothetical protein
VTAMSATLTIQPRPDLGDGVREYVCDCPHGTTRGLAVDGRATLTDTDVVRMILARHDSEGCTCTHPLRERYALVRPRERR